MMDKREAIEFLKQRLGEIPRLAKLRFDNQEYPLWRSKIRDVLEVVFGRDSSEYQDFSRCNWQVPMRRMRMLESLNEADYLANLQCIETVLLGIIQKYGLLPLSTNYETRIADKQKGKADVQIDELLIKSSNSKWKDIKTEFGVTKTNFGKRINFIKDPFKRIVIFRDVEQAFILAKSGFSKPAVILAGGVIEELLRLYLKQKGISPQKPLKNDFNGYVQTCEQKGVLKAGISRLSDSVRHFRNLVHLSNEETKRHTISKATAIGAVSSIFTIVNDFEVVDQQLDSLRAKEKNKKTISINGKKLKIVRFDPSQGLNIDNLQAVLDLHFHNNPKVHKVALQDLLGELLNNNVTIEEIEDGYYEVKDVFPQIEAELSECLKVNRLFQTEVARLVLDLTHDAYWSYHKALMPKDLVEIITKWRAVLLRTE